MKQLSLTDKTGFVIIGNLLPRINSFLLLIILARILSKEDYGTYSQIVMVGMLAYAVFCGGISESLYFFLPQLKGNSRKLFVVQTMFILFASGMMAGGSIWLISDHIGAWFNNNVLSQYLPIYSIYLVFWIARDYFVHYLITINKLKFSIAVNFIDTFSNLIVTGVPFLMGQGFTEVFTYIAILSFVKFAACFMYIMITLKPIRFQFEKKIFHDHIRYFMPLTLSSWIDSAGNQLGKIVVSVFYPPAVLAIYAVGAIKIPIWQILTKSSNAVLRVRFAELYSNSDFEQIIKTWAQAVRKLNLIILPIVFILFANAEHLIALIFTERYAESITVFRIFLFYYLLAGISTSLIPISIGKTQIITVGSAYSVALNLVMSVIFLQIFGYVGPAIAAVLSYYIISYYYLIKSKNLLSVTMADILPWKQIGKLLLINVCCLSLSYPLNWMKIGSIYSIFIISAVFLLSYCVLVMKFNLFYEEDKKNLLRWLKLETILSK